MVVYGSRQYTAQAQKLTVPGEALFYKVRRPEALSGVLPKRFAVKFRPNVDEEEVRRRMEKETSALRLLKGLSTVPEHFDEVEVRGKQGCGIAIELMHGEDLFELSEPRSPIRKHLDVALICAGIKQCFENNAARQVEHWDAQLRNLMVVRRTWQQYALLLLSFVVGGDLVCLCFLLLNTI